MSATESEHRGIIGMMKPYQDEPFFITEKIAAELIAAGYVFKPLLIACTSRHQPMPCEKEGDVVRASLKKACT